MTNPNEQPMYGNSPLLGAMPLIRSGDNVFIMGAMPSFTDTMRSEAKSNLERGMLAYDQYRCPFDFITEHRQWFEWHKRLYFDKQTTGKIITTMLADVKRIKAHKIEREIMFRAMSVFDVKITSPIRYIADC